MRGKKDACVALRQKIYAFYFAIFFSVVLINFINVHHRAFCVFSILITHTRISFFVLNVRVKLINEK